MIDAASFGLDHPNSNHHGEHAGREHAADLQKQAVHGLSDRPVYFLSNFPSVTAA